MFVCSRKRETEKNRQTWVCVGACRCESKRDSVCERVRARDREKEREREEKFGRKCNQ